jgi:adenosylcobinamide-GDP ribazoletransferase
LRSIKNIIAAFQFLTSIPLPIKTDHDNLNKSIFWFPLIGAVIGFITGYGYLFLNQYLSNNLSSIAVIFIYLIITRGLHLDGFIDTIDGFFSRKNRPAILTIMKESTTGSFAIMGTGIWFLTMFATLPLLKPEDQIIIHTLSRLNIILIAVLFPYARKNGWGKFFVKNANINTFILTMTPTFIAICLINLSYVKYFFLSILVSLFIGIWSEKKINGITGDILGFTVETTNLILLVSLNIKI